MEMRNSKTLAGIVLFGILSISVLNCNNSKPKEDNTQVLLKQLLLLGVITYNSSSVFEQYALSSIDLSRYAGEWYEIERTPNQFQGNLSNVKAIYTPRGDGNITVTNEGTNSNGTPSSIAGIGIPASLPRAVLKVSFFYPVIFSDYYVVGLDTENYSHALVGSATPNILWILSRTPTLSTSVVDDYKQKARTMGYSVDLLKSYRN